MPMQSLAVLIMALDSSVLVIPARDRAPQALANSSAFSWCFLSASMTVRKWCLPLILKMSCCQCSLGQWCSLLFVYGAIATYSSLILCFFKSMDARSFAAGDVDACMFQLLYESSSWSHRYRY